MAMWWEEKGGLTHVGFSAGDLRATWQQMLDAREEVLALFR